MTNPFRPGNGIAPPYLAGRDEELQWFEKSLATALTLPRNLVLSGIRGTGKTVLLKRFEEVCRKKKWLFVSREFSPRYNQEEELVGAILTDMMTVVRGAANSSKLVGQKIGFVRPQEVINGDFTYRLLSKYIGPLTDRLKAILRDVYSILSEAEFNGLVLLYDEFHSIEDNKAANNFPLSTLLETFGHLQREGQRYYLVLSGLPPLFPNLVEAKTYAERMFSVKKISSLAPAAAREAIIEPLKESGYNFDEALIDRLVAETKGYPYFIQFHSHYLIDAVPREKVGLEEFEAVAPLLLRELDSSFFVGRYEQASENEREVLLAMAKIGETARVSQIREKTNLSTNTLNQILLNLIEKGLIYRIRRGVYTFALPLFNEFLLRNGQ